MYRRHYPAVGAQIVFLTDQRCSTGRPHTIVASCSTPYYTWLLQSVYTLQPVVQLAVQPVVQPAGRNVLNIHRVNK